ncbi:MAG: LysR family transcriptional regulator [Acidobacteriaceae bacterium]|nr:LysR family transcriptional regulator [Acidobacteriaceae bacterium]
MADAKGFSKAARQLKMPTSTVSRRVAELEQALGVRLIERSTRSLRLTDVGAEVLEHAHRSAEIREAIDNIASNHQSKVTGNLRLAAPPSISDSLLAPIVVAFQKEYPEVHIQVFITERIVDQIAEGVDLAFRVGPLEDSSLVARRILTYRHQLVASPEYLQQHKPPRTPQDLLQHRLLAFSFWRPENTWKFIHVHSRDQQSVTFKPSLAINEYDGLATALLAGSGIGDLPPIVQPELLRSGGLVEVMPKWHFHSFHLSLCHLGNRFVPRAVRLFKDLAAKMAPELFPELPS